MPAFRPRLKTLLIAPYLAVILAAAIVIGLLSYRASSNAVNNRLAGEGSAAARCGRRRCGLSCGLS